MSAFNKSNPAGDRRPKPEYGVLCVFQENRPTLDDDVDPFLESLNNGTAIVLSEPDRYDRLPGPKKVERRVRRCSSMERSRFLKSYTLKKKESAMKKTVKFFARLNPFDDAKEKEL
ncbi:uncharacterized protein A4U43_C07F3220 [Asparagus officinalis]|uniref:Uncharacterized protein n=1 Tax=Asparagus officinalis TaxID=4686 RepID=A0A5P1E970_ASPOF|nr:uncharacterized protein A4U43_C07F3220 [Asparagus officinalis]